jgi:glycosyltransferase involved in cell wall biosynthesis
MTETVSAVIAVFNGANYLRESIESMLAQTVPPDEIIVVDDGSTDSSVAIARSFGGTVRVVTQRNSGQAAATAHGISLASGSCLAVNDHDDLWTPDKQELQLAALAADPSLDLVYGLCEQFVSPELGEEEHRRYAPPAPILPGALLQAALVRRSAFDRVGPINPTLHGAGAADWMGRAAEAGIRRHMIDKVVLRRRLHHTNYGRTNPADRDRHLLSVLRAKIRRNASPTSL